MDIYGRTSIFGGRTGGIVGEEINLGSFSKEDGGDERGEGGKRTGRRVLRGNEDVLWEMYHLDAVGLFLFTCVIPLCSAIV